MRSLSKISDCAAAARAALLREIEGDDVDDLREAFLENPASPFGRALVGEATPAAAGREP